MAKQVKSVGDSDRISSLADPILCHILSFLPTEEAVRTSILSRRWRYLFASMSTLDFSDSLAYSKYDNFKNFVDRLLYHPNQVSVECFRMCDISVIDYGDELHVYDDLRLYGWICVVLQRGVKVIDICSELSPVLPIHLFTCQSLVSLKLDLIGELKVPNKVCLPNLKTLHLRYLEFSDGGSMHWLISSCLVLEELIMEHVEFPADIRELNIHNLFLKRFVLCSGEMNKSVYRDFNFDVVINAPNLLYFRYADLVSDSYSLSPMNSLEQADIRVYQYYVKYDADHEFGVSNLLQATCNVKSLYLVIDEAETLIPMCLEPVVTFHKLVELEFVNECEDWQGTWLIEFLNCVPNLNTLHLTLEPPTEGIKPLPEKVPSCLSFHLKEIKFSKFDGETHLFEMISYFLEHATFLEKLMIEMKSLEGEEQLRITNKLLTIPRNSKQCQVVIL